MILYIFLDRQRIINIEKIRSLEIQMGNNFQNLLNLIYSLTFFIYQQKKSECKQIIMLVHWLLNKSIIFQLSLHKIEFQNIIFSLNFQPLQQPFISGKQQQQYINSLKMEINLRRPGLKNKQNQQSFESAKVTLQNSKSLIQKLTHLKKQMQSSLSSKIKEQVHNKHAKSVRYMTLGIHQRADERKTEEKQKQKIQIIRQNIIGFNTEYISPFNIQLQSVYVDHTATSRPYIPIESMINYAKRFSANPHTQFSHYGKYSTQMMNYAHKSLLKSFSADPEKYVALPTGSGSTGAIQKAIKMLKMVQTPQNKPDIFLSPYQHHSNILPWIQFYDSTKVLQHDQQTGLLDFVKIQDQLKNWERQNIIVTVSGASNVTSQVTDLKSFNEVIRRVRKFKKIIFAVDCAAYCCHHQLNLTILDQIDFAFMSPHKNLGGAESCGILLVRKNVVKGGKPSFPGGGTVQFVKGYQKQDVLYDTDVFNRQIAGTPPFLGYYRAALSFELLKNEIGYDFIHERQKSNTQLFIKLINQQNQKFIAQKLPISIVIYGKCEFTHRANVITMNIICNQNVMQHSFISLILADTFGIQLRSGCFCAGPFGMQLLNVDPQTANRLSSIVSVGILKQKPGYLRLDLTFYLQKFEIQYLARAIGLTARYCQNMKMVYTICNDGQIKRHKLFKDTFLGMYSLENHFLAQQTIKKHLQFDDERIKNRKKNLQNQLNQGKDILVNPYNFLKSQMDKQTLKQD